MKEMERKDKTNAVELHLVATVVKVVQEDEQRLHSLLVLVRPERALDGAEDVVHGIVESKASVLHQRLVQLR